MFSVCVSQLRAPVNTQIMWQLGSDRMIGRNALVRQALELGSEWLLFLDDDHTFPPDILVRLLEHDKPIVGCLYLQRQPPFGPIAYSEKLDNGTYKQIPLASLPEKGLVEVHGCGTGGMLIRSEIFRHMMDPWFQYGDASEDLMFCDTVQELGLGPIYIDPGIRMGHLSMSAMWPGYESGEWHVGFQLADNYSIKVGLEDAVEEELAPTPV